MYFKKFFLTFKSIFLEVSKPLIFWNAHGGNLNLISLPLSIICYRISQVLISSTTSSLSPSYFISFLAASFRLQAIILVFDSFIFMLYSSLNMLFRIIRLFCKSYSFSTNTSMSNSSIHTFST